jgi:GlpG protein
MIGQVPDQKSAAAFSDFLVVEGIASQIEASGEGAWQIWVVEEESVSKAAELLAQYQADPTHPRFQGHARKARAIEDQQRQDVEAQGRRVRVRRDIISSQGTYGVGPMCMFLLFASALVFAFTDAGHNFDAYRVLLIGAAELEGAPALAEVRQGEVWRLVTPIFLHFGWIHLLVNSLWVFSLGSLIEARRGTRFMVLFVLASAVIPNLAQYRLERFPVFGGMSGVVFAMAGYAWQRGRNDPGGGIGLDPMTVVMMFTYFFVCWAQELSPSGSLGLFGPTVRVANVVHTGGLLIGVAWGWWDSRRAVRSH